MIDSVAGEDQHRPVGGQRALEQALRDGVNELARLAVGELAPAAAAIAFSEKKTVRVPFDGSAKQLGKARLVRSKWGAGANPETAIGGGLGGDLNGSQRNGAQRSA